MCADQMSPQSYEIHALVTAATAVQVSWATEVARARGGETWRDAGALCIRTVEPRDEAVVMFPPRPDGSGIDSTLGRCRERGVPRIGVWASGLGDDEALRAVLEARHFVEGWRPHWMCRDVEEQPSGRDPRVELTEVPELRSWRLAAREDGAEVGSAWLHVPDMAPHVGGVLELLVDERARRRGLGGGLVNAAMDKAAELGCRQSVVNAVGDGEPLFAALGFRSLCHGRTWWLDLRR
jgi:GNAT superfamily N-acetyltransferase